MSRLSKRMKGKWVRSIRSLGQMRRVRRTLVWVLLTVFLLPLSSLDQLVAQAYAQRQDECRQLAQESPKNQDNPITSIASHSDYSDLLLASRLQTADEFAVSLSSLDAPKPVSQPEVAVIPHSKLAAGDNSPRSVKRILSQLPKISKKPPIRTEQRVFAAGTISMVGPELARPARSAFSQIVAADHKNRPEQAQAGLVLNYREIRYMPNPIAGQVIHASLFCLDLQGGQSSRPRWLPSPAEHRSQLPAGLDEWIASANGTGYGKHLPAVGSALRGTVHALERARVVDGSCVSHQIYCAMHRANGPPQVGTRIASPIPDQLPATTASRKNTCLSKTDIFQPELHTHAELFSTAPTRLFAACQVDFNSREVTS